MVCLPISDGKIIARVSIIPKIWTHFIQYLLKPNTYVFPLFVEISLTCNVTCTVLFHLTEKLSSHQIDFFSRKSWQSRKQFLLLIPTDVPYSVINNITWCLFSFDLFSFMTRGSGLYTIVLMLLKLSGSDVY